MRLPASTAASVLLIALLGATAAAGPVPQDAPVPVAEPVPAPRDAPAPAPRDTPAPVDAPEGAPDAAADGDYTPEELDELVLPVALFPDVLLNQVLIACESPKELAAADRMALGDGAIKPPKSWSAGVTAMLHVPTVLNWLVESRLWSAALGEVHRRQPREVVAAIQRVRGRARELGNLDDDEQRLVVERDGRLLITLQDEAVLRIPVYDPSQVLLAHTAECPGWFAYGHAVTIPGFRSLEAGFRSLEFERSTRPTAPAFYTPAPPLVASTTTVVRRGGLGLRWILRGGDGHRHHH